MVSSLSRAKIFLDVKGLLPMTKDGYAFGEPFLAGAHDLRIQRIGSTVKAFKRVSVSGAWKTNTGFSEIVRVETTEEFSRWTELASSMFGAHMPMDICTVDAVVDAEGKSHILEVNGTSSGLAPEEAAADNEAIRDLILLRL